MPVLESEVEKKACKYAKENGVVAIKISPMSVTGWPDRLFIKAMDRWFFIEFKAEGKKPRKLQWYRMDLLRALGVHVYWTDNLEEAKDIIYAYLDPA